MKFAPLVFLVLIGTLVGMWLPSALGLSADDGTMALRIYRVYYMVYGGLLAFCILVLMGKIRR